MSRSRQLRAFVCVAVCVVFVATVSRAQYVEQNVNMVAGTQWPHGDPFLQRQNEPSVAVSTRNPLHLLAGANDYRSVDIPFDTPASPDNEERGDAWVGVFKSRNGGQTWWSDLLDGYPQQLNSTSPLHGFAAAADPVVRSGPNGMFYYSGIVLNRDSNPLGAVFVARFIDNNNTENGDPFSPLGVVVIDKGTSGAFLDKPWIAVGPGTGQCTVNGQTFAAQNVYIAYTIFVGGDNNIRTKLMFARSTDCGATWSAPIKLSEGYPVNQGAQIVVTPNNGPIYVVWRQFKSTTYPDSILIAKSADGGQTFTKGAVSTTIHPFEQGMVGLPSQPAIRTNAYPSAAADSSGRLYVVWSDRNFNPNNDGRIVMMHSLDGVNWTGPFVVDANNYRGHQFMPTVSTAGGRVVVAYYDLRDDSTMGVFASNHNGTYNEQRVSVGDRPADPTLATPVFSTFLQEYAGEKRRHTLDLRATELNVTPAGPTLNGFTRVSRYVFGTRSTVKTDCPNGVPGCIEQLQYNPPDLPLFRLGTTPFLGDYIDLAAYAPKSSPVYHIAWTDNRDVRPPADGNWANYHAVGPGHTSTFDGQTVTTDCTAANASGQTGMRNQNIYTARITDGVFAGSAGNAKQLTIQRAFAVFVQNPNGGGPRNYQLIATLKCPAGTTCTGTASFDQINPGISSTVLTVPAHSTATRTVYASSSNPHSSVIVDVTDIGTPSNTTQVVLNPDVSNPDVSNPDVSNPDVSNPDVSNPDVSNPDVSNSEVHNPDVSNPSPSSPDVSNPDVSNPDVSNPDVSNTGLSNPDVSNPDVSNPDVSNPDVSNPDVSNPDVSNSSLGDSTDTTWTIKNKGNTTSGFGVKLFSNSPVDPNSVHTQLIVYRLYQTPIGVGCNLQKQTQRQILSNVIDPTFATTLNGLNSSDANATVWLPPFEGARVTIRVYAPRTVFNPATQVAPVVAAQAINVLNGIRQSSASVAFPPNMPLLISTDTVLDAVTAQPYTTPFAALGGTPPYTWSVNVPSGATIDGSGLMTYSAGFPTAGAQSISISVTDAAGTRATRRYAVNVYAPLVITTTQLPSGSVNLQYPATTLAATGGKTAYTWGVYKGFIPSGMTLDPATGTLSGTPTQTANEFLTLKVSDSANPPQTALQQFGFTITTGLAIATTSLPNAAQGFAYSTTLTSTGGVPPIHWSPVSSTPDGMTLSDDGTLSGVCPFTETPVFQVRATDSNNVSVVSQPLTLTVNGSVCPGSIFQLFDNSNTLTVSNGGVSPSFSTGGQTYCLDSLITYHFNNGQGAAPGSIGLTTNCSTSCTILGPWTATGSAGQGGPNENWTASPAPQLIVMNGTYNIADSDPATWSQNTTSNGFGFSHVWVKAAVPTTMVAVPATDAAGIGQLVVLNLGGLSTLSGVTVTFTDQNNATGTGFLFLSPSTPSRLYVELPAGLANGPLTVNVNVNGSSVASTTIIQSTTPGTPVIQAIRSVTTTQSPCGNINQQQTTSTIVIGGTIGVSAFGTDTTGAEVRFTQGNTVRIVGTSCGVDNPSIGENAIIVVPADLAIGPVDISIRTTVNGVTSGWSQPVTVTAAPSIL